MAARLPHPRLPQDTVSWPLKAPTGLHRLLRRRLRYRTRLVAGMLAVTLPLMIGLAALLTSHASTSLAASGELGAIHEVTSPDDNLQAVFQYLVKT